MTSGTLDALLDAGYEYAFLSNSDNLGAVLDPRILAGSPARAPVRDGGVASGRAGPQGRPPRAAARRRRLVLRETAQTPEEDLDALADIDRHRYVNTNNLWVDLQRAARRAARARRRARAADDRQQEDRRPGDKSTPEVFQLETAMGAAIGVIRGRAHAGGAAAALRAGQDHDDLLRAALGRLRADRRTASVSRRADLATGRAAVELDPKFFKLLRDFDARFPRARPRWWAPGSSRSRGT
jgi:UTP--glucose-1-phosphate uridylyltransferase